GEGAGEGGGEEKGRAELDGRRQAEGETRAQTARLMVRANELLLHGNIGAARIVFERAAEMGNAEAIFALAVTYDPLVLFKMADARNARRRDEGSRTLCEGSCSRHSGSEGTVTRVGVFASRAPVASSRAVAIKQLAGICPTRPPWRA